LPGDADLVSPSLEAGQQFAQLLDVRTELAYPAKRVGDRAERSLRFAVELRETPFQSVELRAQDEHARSTFLEQAPELRLGQRARRLPEYVAQTLPQYGVELQPRLGHDGLGA
jgi:hypothetical protein